VRSSQRNYDLTTSRTRARVTVRERKTPPMERGESSLLPVYLITGPTCDTPRDTRPLPSRHKQTYTDALSWLDSARPSGATLSDAHWARPGHYRLVCPPRGRRGRALCPPRACGRGGRCVPARYPMPPPRARGRGGRPGGARGGRAPHPP
jgi:hypothetical protein